MLETSARLLKLLSLLQSPRDWSGAALAAELGVGVRTVRRDVEKLRTLGYPVDALPGVAGYRLGAGAALPPLLLDDEEAVAVAIGLRAAATGSVAGIEESSVRALTKLEQVLPSRLRHRIKLLQAVAVTPSGGPPVDPDVLLTTAAASRDHQRLRFDYRNHDGTATTRTTEPHRLVHTGRRWYLVAWDLDRSDWRTFRLDRLLAADPDRAAIHSARGARPGHHRSWHRLRWLPVPGPVPRSGAGRAGGGSVRAQRRDGDSGRRDDDSGRGRRQLSRRVGSSSRPPRTPVRGPVAARADRARPRPGDALGRLGRAAMSSSANNLLISRRWSLPRR